MAAQIVVLGFQGLVGSRVLEILSLTHEIRVGEGETAVIKEVLCVDLKGSSPSLNLDPRFKLLQGDITDPAFLSVIFDTQPQSVEHVVTLHLAALLSGYAEDDFDLGLKVNLYGPLEVMQAIRRLSSRLQAPQRYIFVSTDYVFCFNEYNVANPCHEETFRLSPVSYGIQKACIENLVCDFHRKGYLDGYVARLSAVIGRPGFSNSISFAWTGVFTQTLGRPPSCTYKVPVPADANLPCSCLQNNAQSLVLLVCGIDSHAVGSNRIIQLAARTFSIRDIWCATQKVAAKLGLSLGQLEYDSVESHTAAACETTVKSVNVCPRVDCSKAHRLGLPMTVDLEGIIADYASRYCQTNAA